MVKGGSLPTERDSVGRVLTPLRRRWLWPVGARAGPPGAGGPPLAAGVDAIGAGSGAAHSTQEGREGLCQAQEGGGIAGLISDRWQLGAQRLFALAQRWHSLTQLLQRQEFFLIGGNSLSMLLPTRVSSLRKLGSRCLVGSEQRAAARRRSSSCWIKVESSSKRMTSAHTI
jgi:hypothetical protein